MKIDIFKYMSARLFLQDIYRTRKQSESDFSYYSWASELQLGSKTLLRLILQGKRNISDKTRGKFHESLGLAGRAAEYFDALIDYEQATSARQRQLSGAKLHQLQVQNFLPRILEADAGVLSDAYGPVVLAAVGSAIEPMSRNQLVELLSMDLDRVNAVVHALIESGLIFDSEGLLHAGKEAFQVRDAFGNQKLRSYYDYWLPKATTAMDLPFEIRRFRSLQLVLSQEEFLEVTTVFNECLTSILSRAERNSLPGRRVYVMNHSLFPVTGVGPFLKDAR